MAANSQEIANLFTNLLNGLHGKYYGREFPAFVSLEEFDKWLGIEVQVWSEAKAIGFLNFLRNTQSLVREMIAAKESDEPTQRFVQRVHDLLRQYNKNDIVTSHSALGIALRKAAVDEERSFGFQKYLSNDINHFGSEKAFDGAVLASQANSIALVSDGAAELKKSYQDDALQLKDQIGALRQTAFNHHKDVEAWLTEQKRIWNDAVAVRESLIKTSEEQWAKKLEYLEGDFVKKLSEHEAAFKEQTRLEKPAEYWRELHESYEAKAKSSAWLAALIAAIGVLCVGLLIFAIPKLQSMAAADAIRVGAMLAFGGTLIVLVLQLAIRLTLSSYHLSRDSMERRQLTHVFLALVKDGAIEEKQRDLVLAALFSRSDTGLLKNDGTPSNPSVGLLELLNRK